VEGLSPVAPLALRSVLGTIPMACHHNTVAETRRYVVRIATPRPPVKD
jgi:hypothetical protein